MDIAPHGYVIAFAGAVVAGMINALAGNGSVITLTILTEMMGLPGVMANGTNRVGVSLNAFGAIAGFRKSGVMTTRHRWRYILPVVVGAMIGIYVATLVSSVQFMWVFKGVMVMMFFVVLFHPDRWLIAHARDSTWPQWLEWPAMLILGFYGGFIQMGMGIFYLAVLVLIARLPLLESNAIKVISVGIYTALAVIIFAAAGLVEWPIGLLMGAGQFVGGWTAARYVSKFKQANRVAYYVLLFSVCLSILMLFDVV